MGTRRLLSPEEGRRCVEFLQLLGVKGPGDRFLSDRGYFGLFLCGLHPEEVPKDIPPDERQFKEMIRLLSEAGVEQIRGLFLQLESPPPSPSATPPPGEASTSVAPSSGSVSKLDGTTGGAAMQTLKSNYSKELSVIRPTPEDFQHFRELDTQAPETAPEAITLAESMVAQGRFQDAHHVLFHYLLTHPLTEDAFIAETQVILRASQFDKGRSIAPHNMLYECEEMAALLVRRIPNLHELKERGGSEATNKLYHFVKLVYGMWAMHCRRLLEYKYRLNDKEWIQRNWLDPRDFGFLVDLMRMGVRSHLPLDLLRYIYHETRKCIDMGKVVIAHRDKQAQFEAEALRMIASPTRDVVPDLTFEIFREIINAYMTEGDTANALIFTKQALLIHKTDKDLNRIKTELEDRGAQKRR